MAGLSQHRRRAWARRAAGPRHCAVLALLATALAAPAPAQSCPDAPPRSVAERLALPASAVPLLAPSFRTVHPGISAVQTRSSGRGTALAMAGGALFVGGLIAGGDAGTLLVVAGAGIGALGLYIMLSP